MDTITIYKQDYGYYKIHSEKALSDGYKIIKKSEKYTIFGKQLNDNNSNNKIQTDIVNNK
jgi:hypothetical protein